MNEATDGEILRFNWNRLARLSGISGRSPEQEEEHQFRLAAQNAFAGCPIGERRKLLDMMRSYPVPREYFRCQDCGHLREHWERHERNGRQLDAECFGLREREGNAVKT